jgi:hypothetical protein
MVEGPAEGIDPRGCAVIINSIRLKRKIFTETIKSLKCLMGMEDYRTS